jgi:serine/threonine-protein kinase
MSFNQFPMLFGKYIVLDRVSAGGMAEVYRAKEIRESGFSKIIAIKRMLDGVALDATMAPMFVDEAKLAAQLVHPNIAQTLELGRIDDALYIAMELVWGRDLKAITKACSAKHVAFPVGIASYVVAKAAEALDFAHNALGADGRPMRLVHRDVSPHNIMLDYDGEVKVIDFGVAKAEAKSSETVAGVIKGKFSYMAPEQVIGAVRQFGPHSASPTRRA